MPLKCPQQVREVSLLLYVAGAICDKREDVLISGVSLIMRKIPLYNLAFVVAVQYFNAKINNGWVIVCDSID